MKNKKDGAGQLQLNLQFDFYHLRKELSVRFGNIPEILIKNQDTDLAWLALDVGKFMVWNAGIFDRYTPHCESLVRIKTPTVKSLGLTIRNAAVATLEGRDVQISNRNYQRGLEGINNRLDEMQKLILSGGAR